MAVVSRTTLFASIFFLSVGLCFGAAIHHWTSMVAAAGIATPKPGAAAPGTTGSDQEQLVRLQEAVLKEVEDSNTATKDMLNFALLAVGFVSTILVGTIGYFGFSTASDLRNQKERADTLISELQAARAAVLATEETIRKSIWEGLRVPLSNITQYGLKIAEFAGDQWANQSFEDRLRNCDEAADALRDAGLDDGGHRALSFILARKGLAYLDANDPVAAVGVLQDACRYNAANKPDRPYNLACAYGKLAQMNPAGATRETYVRQCIEQLRQCLIIATDAPAMSTISKAYFREKMFDQHSKLFDHDLDVVRNSAEFAALKSL